MSIIKETKEMQYFEDTAKDLLARHNNVRDEILQNIVKENYEKANDLVKKFQVIATGIQLCQQSIARDAELKQRQEAAKAVPVEPPKAPVFPIGQKKEKKGWFR